MKKLTSKQKFILEWISDREVTFEEIHKEFKPWYNGYYLAKDQLGKQLKDMCKIGYLIKSGDVYKKRTQIDESKTPTLF